ncbi:unnamed protein product [Ilex paraguariensis]|uniref:Uncharacterized protein n=1 Tax=Ilex paraguariensis TaxID=185542 RepID=A0ABC8RKP1_9AQUA
MDYLINNMGLETSELAKRTNILSHSLEQRIVPRCSVYGLLLSKGVDLKGFHLTTMLVVFEKRFIGHIEKSYRKEAPELLKLYQEMLDLSKPPAMGFHAQSSIPSFVVHVSEPQDLSYDWSSTRIEYEKKEGGRNRELKK